MGTDNVYSASPAAANELRITHLRDAVIHHRNHNSFYDSYCEQLGFGDGSRFDDENDLDRIPLLPSGVFKHHAERVRTGGTSGPVIATTSTGTQGTRSVVPRDDRTLMRFFASVAIGNRELLGIEAFDRPIFNLGPPTVEAPDLWISYVMAGVAVIFTTHFYVRNGVFEMRRLAADLRAAQGGPISLVGPPPLLLDLAAYLEENGRLALGADALVVAIGGWKRRASETVPRDAFDARIASAFGIPSAERIRDTYNMVELNAVLFECRFKTKHCPPWVRAGARDARTLAPLSSGCSGVLAFFDPTATSYPGFVLSDDLGTVVRRSACACGIVGDAVSVERRLNRVETRGCALKLQRLIVPDRMPP